jgi:putative serine protease PepD
MTSSLLRPPERPDLWSSDEEREARRRRGPGFNGGAGGDGGAGGGGGDGRPGSPGGRSPRRAPVAVLLAVCALLGGGVGAGVVAATGVGGGDSAGTTTIVQRAAASTSSSSGDGAAAGGLDAKALYASTSAGVVDITSKGVSSGSQQASPFNGAPQQQSQSTATGTGFEIDAAGTIVTASHVVDGASSITVTLENGMTRTAKLLGQDDATDVAVLKIDPSNVTLHPLKLASSASLNVGDEVAAIGDPFGYARSISTGIVSGVDRTIEAPNGFTVAHAIQTDAALNPGNSGGPVLNAAGEVVGIADQIATGGTEQNSGVGFAVPVDLVSAELSKLKAGQKVSHAYLGVATSGAAGSVRGATLGTLTSGGPAADAGLRAGDIITKFGAAKVTNANDLVAAIADGQPGDQVKVVVKRGSATVEKTVTLGTQPAQSTSGG